MHTLSYINTVHYSNDLLKVVSKDIASRYNALLPDLRNIIIFLPNQLSQSLLREAILKEVAAEGYTAVFPPELITLRQWARNTYRINKSVLSQYARELILVDAIKQQPDLFSSANPWGVANELLSLFDAMLLNDIKPIQLNNFYQGENKVISHALLHESDLVKVLWEAWQNQITDENYIDPNQAYADALTNIKPSEQDIFYCVGLDQLSKLECDFINRINKQSKLQFFTYSSNHQQANRTDNWLKKYSNPDTQYTFIQNENEKNHSNFLDTVFSDSAQSIKQRAEIFSKTHPKKTSKPLRTYKSNSFERHTKAIDLQIRIWINENKNNIGVVTADRKLVRRLRAVLEHAGVTVNDAAGWALATTSAAVIIEWWLQLVEEKFPAKQLLALATSPFFPITDNNLHEHAINFFEKDIVLRFNLHNGIHRYRNALEKMQDKDPTIDPKIFDYLAELLNKFESSSQILSKLHGNKSYPLHRFISELLNSLKPIGLYTTLTNDDAGKQIIELFEEQITHFKLVDNLMNWSESRRFMSRIFDQQNYKPPTSQLVNKACVTFFSLEQSRLQSFDALIIASVDKNNFPGTSGNYIFFNEQVRTDLNIPTWRDDHARHLHQFRSLLDSSNEILVTVQTEQNGEKTTACPWLEAIETFYHMAYKKDLSDKALEYLVEQESTSVKKASTIPMPTIATQPSPELIPELKPNSISISQYQSLVNCPYQYFALTCLKLLPTDELKEEIGKADFGSLVHQSIHAFFSNIPNLPGPFTSKITNHNRHKAEELLNAISRKVFTHFSDTGLNDDFFNELWLQRWSNLIPKFIDWEINRQQSFTPHAHETAKHLNINQSSLVHGRIDRVDQSTDNFAVIDYKTGETPKNKNIQAGEEVQLPMYALLNEDHSGKATSQVEFVSIGKDNTVKSTAIIKDDELYTLKNEHLHRLQSFFDSLNQNTAFTALANNETCERCNAYGVCRKSFWEH